MSHVATVVYNCGVSIEVTVVYNCGLSIEVTVVYDWSVCRDDSGV